MQPINMINLNNAQGYRKNTSPPKNTNITKHLYTQSFKAIDDDKYIIRKEIENPNIINKLLSKIGIRKPQKIQIEVKPQVDKSLIDDEKFDILSEAFKESGKILKIERVDTDNYGLYGKVTLENGYVAILPRKENILPKDELKEKIINNANKKLSLLKISSELSAMDTLYDIDFEDLTKEAVQPKTPYVLDESDIKTNPNDKDNYLEPRKNLSRKNVAALLRFGEHSLTNGKRAQTTSMITWHLNKKISKDIKTSDIRVINGGYVNGGYGYEDKYIYYNPKSNLSTIFNSKGEPLAQVAFDSHFDYGEAPVPTNYQLYSLYDNTTETYRSFVE